MLEVEIVVAPALETRIDLAAEGLTGPGRFPVPADAVVAIAVVGCEVVTAAEPPHRRLAGFLRHEHAHIGVRRGHIGIAGVDNKGNAHGLETAPGQLRPGSTGGRRQAGAHHVGEIDPGPLEYRALAEHAAAAAATFLPLPFVDNKPGLAILVREPVANGRLPPGLAEVDTSGPPQARHSAATTGCPLTRTATVSCSP